jgi:hypothetical protein
LKSLKIEGHKKMTRQSTVVLEDMNKWPRLRIVEQGQPPHSLFQEILYDEK